MSVFTCIYLVLSPSRECQSRDIQLWLSALGPTLTMASMQPVSGAGRGAGIWYPRGQSEARLIPDTAASVSTLIGQAA